MTLPLTNNFESGTSGITITAGNSGSGTANAFDNVIVSNGAAVYSSTTAAHGTLSGSFSTTAAGGVAYTLWTSSVGTQGTVYGRAYFNITANPAAADANVQHRGTGGSSAGNIQIGTTRQLIMQTPAFTTSHTFTSVIPLNTWIRVEWQMVAGGAGVGSLTVNYYATADSTTVTETFTDNTNAWGGTGGIAEVDFGWTNTHASQPTLFVDDVGVSATGFLGPAVNAGTGSFALQPMRFSGNTPAGGLPTLTNVVSGSVINDYGLDNVFYTVATTGQTTMLVAFLGWDVGPYTFTSSGKAPAVNVTDSAGNLWRQVGISTVSSVSRSAIWACDNPRQVQWISVALTGWGYSTSYTIAEIDNVPSSLATVAIDFVQTANQQTAVTALTVPTGTATGSDIVFGVLSTGGSGGALTVPSGWTGIAASGGALSRQATTYSMWIPSQGAGSVSFIPTWATAQPASGIIVGLKTAAPAPVQFNPSFPRIVVEAAFGATPGDWTQSVDYTWDVTGLTWTDISSRVIGDGTAGKIRVTRGRQYELSQEETGEIDITLDNHDGVFTSGNTASPYYPNVIPGVPVRVTAWFGGTQYPVAFGYVERWPQEWPELPQWGFSTVIATDAYGPLAATSLPSAVEGEVRKDGPYAYFATDEQYSFTTQSLDPVKAPIDANGLIAINKAPGNGRYGAYRDGFDQAVTTGQALNLLGDSDTVMGATTYVTPEINANGPGLFYFDPNIPTNTSGFTLEFWFTWGGGVLASTTLLNAWAGPSSFYNSVPTIGTVGGVISVGINTGNNLSAATGFWVNGNNIASLVPFTQTSFAPQHFVLVSGPTGLYGSSLNCYLNNTGVGISGAGGIVPHPKLRALSLGPTRFAYDVSDLCVYNGYNFSAGHLAVYPYELTPAQIQNHYNAGIFGAGYIPAPGRFAQMLTWGLLGLKRGGTAWYSTYGNVENTFMSEAYSFEGSTGADVMAQVTQTEGGRCFVQANGSLVYVMRWWRYNQPSVATFGDNGITEFPFLQESSFGVDNSFIYNTITGTQNRGPEQTFFVQQSDSTSQTEYFNRSGLQLQSYSLTPFDVFDNVNWSMAKYKQPVQRVQRLSLNVASAQGKLPAMFPAVLGLELNQTVTVNRRPVGGAVMSVTGTIQEIQHEIGPNVWNTRYQIAPVYPENQALIADVNGQNTPGSQSLSW